MGHRKCYQTLVNKGERLPDQTNVRDATRIAREKGSDGDIVEIFYDQHYGDLIKVKEFVIAAKNASE